FQRFRKIIGALSQLVKQPRILDGDYSLRGEVSDNLNLLIGEWQHFLTIDGYLTDHLVVLKHGHIERRASARQLENGEPAWIFDIGWINTNVGDLNRLFGPRCSAKRALAKCDNWLAPQDLSIGGRGSELRDGSCTIAF